jgi:hypothetical protein
MHVLMVVAGGGVHVGALQFIVCITAYGIPEAAGVVVLGGSSYVGSTEVGLGAGSD